MTSTDPSSDVQPDTNEVQIQLETVWRDNKLQVRAIGGSGTVLHSDNLDPSSHLARTRFLNSLRKKLPAIADEHLAALEAELLQKTNGQQSTQQNHASDAPGEVGLDFHDHSPENIAALVQAAARLVDARLAKKLDGIDESARAAAMQLGRDSRLLRRIVDCIAALGHVGERKTCALLTLCYGSSRLQTPLHALVVGESSSGKSHLCDKASRIIPPELTKHLTEMTPKFLGYLSPFDVAYKVIVMGERRLGDEEIVAEKNKFRREMISVQYVIHGTVESHEHGQHASKERLVLGPIASSETTTKTTIFAEDQNRTIVLEVDLSEEQTQAILQRQAAEANGTAVVPDPEQLRDIHNCLRLLKRPARILLPFADLVTALMPTHNLEVRRIQQQFFDLVRVCAFLHQMQRRAERIDGSKVAWEQRGQMDHTLFADPRDYETVANLMNQSLQRALRQKLSESDKRGLFQLQSWVANRAGQTPSVFLTPEALRGLRTAGGHPLDPANFRKQLRRFEDQGAVALLEQGERGFSSKWELLLLDGQPKDKGWGVPPTYSELCRAFEAKADRDVPDDLSPQAFQDEEWFDDFGAALREWENADKPGNGAPNSHEDPAGRTRVLSG